MKHRTRAEQKGRHTISANLYMDFGEHASRTELPAGEAELRDENVGTGHIYDGPLFDAHIPGFADFDSSSMAPVSSNVAWRRNNGPRKEVR
jgi:hypothetical protein